MSRCRLHHPQVCDMECLGRETPPQHAEKALNDVRAERASQDAKWGQQDHADGTRPTIPSLNAREHARHECEYAFAHGIGTWRHILEEEVTEAFAESDPTRLREELIQVAAVAVAWAEAIDRRYPPASTPDATRSGGQLGRMTDPYGKDFK